MKSIEQARQEVQTIFAAALEVVDKAQRQSLSGVEVALWSVLLQLGRALLALFLARQAVRPRPAQYEHDGKAYRVAETTSSEIGTRFGKVVFSRPVGRQIGSLRAVRDLPIDRELGLCSGFSLPAVSMLVKLCAQMSFAAARKTFLDILLWRPSSRATLRMIDAAGEQARPFLEQAPPPEDDGDVLMITVDGKGAPSISSREYGRRTRQRKPNKKGTKRRNRRERRREYPRPRRAPGKKSKNAKVAAVGVLYTLRKTAEGMEGPINKRVYATFESYRALFEWLDKEAKKRGYGTQRFRRVVFVADGADTLWALQQEFFPDADVCLDWYHVVEKLWKAGKCLHRDNPEHRAAWVAEQKRRLRRGEVDAVLDELRALFEKTPRTGPGNKSRRFVLEKTLKHLEKNVLRLQYQRLRRHDIDIGSGVVEGAVRHLVGVRLDGPGMRWGRDRAESILLLRCILINDQWDAFVEFLAAKPQLRLRAQPLPTRTHDAVQKKAA